MDATCLNDMTILYVEDDVAIRDVFSEELSHNVKKVYVADNGEEGYELFKKHKPDIVVTDIMMPILNGVDMSRRIRAKDEYVPIVITSSSQDKHYLEETLDIGVSGYMSKPVNLPELEELLTSICSLLHLEDQKKMHEKILKDRFNMQRLLS